jgi:hypothetical protein
MREKVGIALAVVALAACDQIGMPRVPQVEQAREAVEDGGDRYRTHRACVQASTSADALIGCMRNAGWTFVARGPGYPEADCWQGRDRGEVDRIIPLCFTKATPAAPAP